MGDAENYYYEQLNQGLGAKLSIKGKNSDQKFGLNFYKTIELNFHLLLQLNIMAIEDQLIIKFCRILTLEEEFLD